MSRRCRGPCRGAIETTEPFAFCAKAAGSVAMEGGHGFFFTTEFTGYTDEIFEEEWEFEVWECF